MARRRIRMRRVREVLRYHFEQGLSNERIAGALSMSKGGVHNILSRFKLNGLAWPLPANLSDSELERGLYPPQAGSSELPRAVPDVDYIEGELRRPHVTLELLWREFVESHPATMSRATFYRFVRQGLPKDVDLKMLHKGGDKVFVDFSGDGVEYIDRNTGEIHEAPLFVASWGASSYTFARALDGEDMEQFVRIHERAFRYFGCAPHALVPDNCKVAVIHPNRYEPQIAALYEQFGKHYQVAILPARVRAPKDKAVVESAVGFVQRYILGRLRNRRFFSVQEINEAIPEILERLNDEPMQAYRGQTRRQRYEALDKPFAQPLPAERFVVCAVKSDATVAPNYHVRFDDHYYSVPHHIARQKVDIYLVGNIVEIYHDGVHVTRHLKQPGNFGYSTKDEHMPSNHQFVRGWSKEWFIDKAGHIGMWTAEAVKLIMKRHRHPQQGFNSALGVLNLAHTYTPQRLEAAARRAIHFRSLSTKSIRTILEKNLDAQPLEQPKQYCLDLTALKHENVRGPQYYTSNQGE
ncbi:MAG: IS21 family transposase [Chitinivibrionales bacterium]|nr:IS21 family transposase [Chitinivibrionales bacterium]MBD3395531.1 IS21 family transposase [Chitinivibrionales bacterium]